MDIPKELKLAYEFALEKHKGQFRKYSKTEYITHPIQMVCILSKFTSDIDTLTAALLHDVVENTNTDISEIYTSFGYEVGGLVEELTINELEKELYGKKIYLVNKINNMSTKAFTIKLVDRLHNVMGLNSVNNKDFIFWYINETKYILNNIDRFIDDIQKSLLDAIDIQITYLELTIKHEKSNNR